MKHDIENILLSVFDIDHDARGITNWLESTASVSKKYNNYASWEFIAFLVNFAFIPEIVSIALGITNHHKNVIFMTVSFMIFLFAWNYSCQWQNLLKLMRIRVLPL